MARRIVQYGNGRPAQFAGTNIEVWRVVRALLQGVSLDQLAVEFPRLTPADMVAAQEYYLEYKGEIAACISCEGSK